MSQAPPTEWLLIAVALTPVLILLFVVALFLLVRRHEEVKHRHADRRWASERWGKYR
jgi:hypothetical protein